MNRKTEKDIRRVIKKIEKQLQNLQTNSANIEDALLDAQDLLTNILVPDGATESK